LLPYSDTTAMGMVAEVPIVYADEDVARLLAEVERRSNRRRRRQQHAAQTAACLAVAMAAWLASVPAASGAVGAGQHGAAATALDIGRPSRSGA